MSQKLFLGLFVVVLAGSIVLVRVLLQDDSGQSGVTPAVTGEPATAPLMSEPAVVEPGSLESLPARSGAAESEPASATESGQVPADLELALIGVVTGGDEAGSIAIIRNQDNEEGLFGLGSNVFGVATLETIQREFVVLRRGDRQITLPLTGGGAAGSMGGPSSQGIDYSQYSIEQLQQMAATAKRVPPPPAEDDSRPPPLVPVKGLPYVSKMREDYSAVRQRSLEEGGEEAWYFLELEPEFRLDQVTGLVITDDNPSNFLGDHGLRVGDVITSIDGAKIDTPEAAAAAMEAIGAKKRLTLTVQRGSTTETVVIEK